MFFSSKSLIFVVLFGFSFYLGFSDDEKQHKGNLNNYSIDQNLNITKRDSDKCETRRRCSKNPKTGRKECTKYCEDFQGPCWTTKNGNDTVACNERSNCNGCWECISTCSWNNLR